MPWRWLFIGIAVLLVMLLALAALFVATFDANSHKARLAAMVKEKTGRELSIPSGVRLKLLPTIRLELDRAVLNEKDSAQPFATIEAVKLSLRPWPLLRSQVMLDQVEIGNFNIALKRFANGTTNFDDLIPEDESPSTLRFDLAGLTIKNGTLRFDDELAQRKTQLTNLKVTTGRLTDHVAAPIRAQFLLAIDNPAAALQTELSGELKFDLQRKRYQIKGAQIQAQGEAVSVKPISIRLAANIDAYLGVGHIAIQEAKSVVDGRSGTHTIHGEFASRMLTSEPNKVSIEQIKAQLKIDDPGRKIGLNATIPALFSASNKIDAAGFKLNFSFDQDVLRSTGELNGALTMDLARQRAVLPKLTFTSKTLRDRLSVDASGTGPMALDLQTGDLDATQLNGDWRMQNEQDQLAGKWRAPLVANLANGGFSVDALQGDWSGKLAGATISGKVSAPVQGNWRKTTGKIPAIDLQTTVTWPDSALEASIQGLALGHADLAASADAGQVAAKGVAVKASGRNPNGKWQADLTSPLKMDFTQQLATLSNLSGRINWVGVSKQARPFNLKLNGTGKIDLEREEARFNLKAGLDQSKFDGAFGITGWADPAYRVDANLNHLDLDRYFPSAAKPGATKPKQNKTPLANLDLTFLKQLKVDGQINIGHLKSAGATARNVRIDMESVNLKKIKP